MTISPQRINQLIDEIGEEFKEEDDDYLLLMGRPRKKREWELELEEELGWEDEIEYLPTPSEIVARMREIKKGWSSRVRESRRVGKVFGNIKVVAPMEMYLEELEDILEEDDEY